MSFHAVRLLLARVLLTRGAGEGGTVLHFDRTGESRDKARDAGCGRVSREKEPGMLVVVG